MGWWPEDQWAQMWRGDGCSMCGEAGVPRNEYSDLIAETSTSFVRLSRNQTQAGYSVVIAKRHGPEWHHLTPEERVGFWSDVSAVGEGI
jgi:diadenosine tetraphosphate (Ap4A) HIT family hydrolase